MFNLLGVHLTLLIGKAVPTPAPPTLLEILDRVQVRHSDDGPSTLQITFRVGRSGPEDLIDFAQLFNPLLNPMNRIVVAVTFGVVPQVLFDGFITHRELQPGNEPGSSSLSITGEDITLMMNLEERQVEHPAQDETVIATKLIASYAQHGLTPMVLPPPVIDPPVPVERTPTQCGTDLEHLQRMAGRYGYVFFVTPGPAPGMSVGYWGPPPRLSAPQRALSVGMGGETNVQNLSFTHDSQAPTLPSGQVQDRLTNQTVPVETFASTRIPLAALPTWLLQQPNVRRTTFRGSGLNAVQSYARAQGQVDASVDRTVTASGSLDAMKYGDLLKPRFLVGLRGAGWSHDGLWYVQSVEHEIRRGQYNQNFTLAREGLGSTVPVVIP